MATTMTMANNATSVNTNSVPLNGVSSNGSTQNIAASMYMQQASPTATTSPPSQPFNYSSNSFNFSSQQQQHLSPTTNQSINAPNINTNLLNPNIQIKSGGSLPDLTSFHNQMTNMQQPVQFQDYNQRQNIPYNNNGYDVSNQMLQVLENLAYKNKRS
jgi:hypothetical protein